MKSALVYGIGRIIPDRIWIQIKYRQWFGRFADLNNPKSFNEKLNWLKLYDRNPDYIGMVDKYEAKQWISRRVGSEYVVPSVAGPWDSVDEIPFGSLPGQFVLKTTHDCGGVVICSDRNLFDLEWAKDFLKKHMKSNYFYSGREWPYKFVKPRVFAEEFISDFGATGKTEVQLTDYKFFCFDGSPKAMFIATDRASAEETKFDFFDMEYRHLPFTQGHPNARNVPDKPKNFELMKSLAAKLSSGLPHLRVDFYEVGDSVYVGELTLFHFSGTVPFDPEEWDLVFGDWLTLPDQRG